MNIKISLNGKIKFANCYSIISDQCGTILKVLNWIDDNTNFIDLTTLEFEEISTNLFKLNTGKIESIEITDPLFLESKNNIDSICNTLRDTLF